MSFYITVKNILQNKKIKYNQGWTILRIVSLTIKIYVLRKNEKFQDKNNELSESNEKLKSNNIDVLDSLCKNVDKKINHEDYGLESLNDQLSPSIHRYLLKINYYNLRFVYTNQHYCFTHFYLVRLYGMIITSKNHI